MINKTLLDTHFPYCMAQQADGSYVLLNRAYKPVGFVTNDHVKYEEHAVGFRLDGLTPELAKLLDAAGRDGLARIYFYDDGTAPDSSLANAEAYMTRLALLMGMRIN